MFKILFYLFIIPFHFWVNEWWIEKNCCWEAAIQLNKDVPLLYTSFLYSHSRASLWSDHVATYSLGRDVQCNS
ncbi:hypothetical protein AAZX31_20G109700 [Glycine max]